MNLSIITVYQPFTNLGSYLQAYALQCVLKKMGHNVTFIPTSNHFISALNLICRVNPKRAFFLRISKAWYSLKDLSKLSYISPQKALKESDLIIYGSDEIWNITNRFFKRSIFWGGGFENKPKIGYAVSIGHATTCDLKENIAMVSMVKDFKTIMSRDQYTYNTLKELFSMETESVIDPTLLVSPIEFTQSIKIPNGKYLLVYTYGLDSSMIQVVKEFAQRKELKIISPFFWHSWADETIECHALQFNSLIQGAEYMLTSTFHGAIFAMINHSRCAIVPIRSKVREVTELLGCSNRLITSDITLSKFEKVINQPFYIEEFEKNLKALRADSITKLQNAINNSKL